MKDFVYDWKNRTDDLNNDEDSHSSFTYLTDTDRKTMNLLIDKKENLLRDKEDSVKKSDVENIDDSECQQNDELSVFMRISTFWQYHSWECEVNELYELC